MQERKYKMTQAREQKMMYKLFDILRRILWLSLRYPAFSSSFIARKINKTTTSRHDLLVYESYCTSQSKSRTILLMLVYVLYCLKNLYVVYESFNLYDYQHFERNIEQLNASHKSISSCLLTDCTRLSPLNNESNSSLGEDASNLPIFSLCHPRIDQLYTPITQLDTFGILFYSLILYSIFVLTTWTPANQLLSPASTDWILFVAAPRATIEVARDKARKFLTEFARSYHNYRLYTLSFGSSKSTPRLKHRWPRRRASDKSETRTSEQEDEEIYEQVKLDKSASVLSRNRRPKSDTKLVTCYNCLPIVRSIWWRQKVTEIFCATLFLVLMTMLSICLIVLYEIDSRSRQKVQLLASFAREMEAHNCFIWRQSDKQQLEIIKLDPFRIEWNCYTLTESLLINFGANFPIQIMFCSFWVLMCEAAIRLAELRMFLVASLLAARIYNLNERPVLMALAIKDKPKATSHDYQHVHPSGSQLLARMHSVYTIPNLRRHFRESIMRVPLTGFLCLKQQSSSGKFSHLLVNSKRNDHYHRRKFLDEITLQRQHYHNHQRDSEEFNIETLEQIYINFRLYVDYIHSLRPTVAIFLAIIYFINYGYVFIAVIIRRNIVSISMRLILVVIFYAYLIANYLIYLCANVHANTKKLQPLIWSIIAELTQWDNLRAKHLRLLWLKQMKMLDNEGGLSLMAFGMRVTYVYILQTLIWTATIFVIALKES